MYHRNNNPFSENPHAGAIYRAPKNPTIWPFQPPSFPARPPVQQQAPVAAVSGQSPSTTMQLLLLTHYLNKLDKKDFNSLVLSLANIFPSLATEIALALEKKAATSGRNPNATPYNPSIPPTQLRR